MPGIGKLHKKLSGIGLFIIVLVASDLFLLSHNGLPDIVSNGTIDKIRGYRYKPYEIYYLIGESGNRYKVHNEVFNSILIGDKIMLGKTRLFNRNATITWCKKGRRCFVQNIHPLNSSYLGIGSLVLVMVLNLVVLLGILQMKTGTGQIYHWLLLIGSAGLLVYYLIN